MTEPNVVVYSLRGYRAEMAYGMTYVDVVPAEVRHQHQHRRTCPVIRSTATPPGDNGLFEEGDVVVDLDVHGELLGFEVLDRRAVEADLDAAMRCAAEERDRAQ